MFRGSVIRKQPINKIKYNSFQQTSIKQKDESQWPKFTHGMTILNCDNNNNECKEFSMFKYNL